MARPLINVLTIAQNADSLLRKSTHTVAVVMNRSGSGAAITEYGHDPNTDMFQVSCTYVCVYVKGFYDWNA